MASAAGSGVRRRDRRKQRTLEAFRDELEQLDAEEIQARLDSNRIRSPERQALARERLRMLRPEDAASDMPVSDGEDGSAGEDQRMEELPAASDVSEPQVKQQARGRKADDAASAEQQAGALALPLARRLGRLVGMAAAVGGVVVAGAWLIRR